MSGTYDAIVIGLGGMGSAAAYHLARRGLRVLGLEQFEMAHAHGSSHGGSRIIRQAYFEDPAYVPLLLRSYELWDEIERESGERIMTTTGGLMMGPEDSRPVAGSIKSAEQWDLDYEVLGAPEIRRRFPTFAPGEEVVALYEAQAGFVRPEASVAAHAAVARARGADLRFGEPVLGWEASDSGEGVRVATERGTYEAERLVISAGPWSSQLLSDLDLPLLVERVVQFWFMPAGGVEPFSADRHPIYIWDIGDDVQFYGFPNHDRPEDGAKVAFFRVHTPCTPETIDRTVHPEEVEQMRDAVRDRIPALDGKFLRAAACMYTLTPDSHFIISKHPERAQVSVAAGFSGHGFKFASVIGEILADLATEGSTHHPIELFDPKRLVGQTHASPGPRS